MMRIVLFCATQRGLRMLKKISELAPTHDVTVVSFREEPWEPPFLDEIARFSQSKNYSFSEQKQAGSSKHADFWHSLDFDLLLAVSWRFMIPHSIYSKARLGAFVFHDSLLPKYRGFSPTVWAIRSGENHTGVTLFEMADDVDSGAIISQEKVAIGPHDYIDAVLERVTQAYLICLERTLQSLLAGTAVRTPQDETLATYTCRLTPEDARINWSQSTRDIYNTIRSYSRPYPGAFTVMDGKVFRIWQADPILSPKVFVGRIPGKVTEISAKKGFHVLTGDGELLITEASFDGLDSSISQTTPITVGKQLGN